MKATTAFFRLAGVALAAAGLLAPVVSFAQSSRADAEKDPVLSAMLQEMDRSMSELQLKGSARPFFIEYRINDVDDFETRAEYGASEGSARTHQRVARVTVRIGDYKTDSSSGRGDGSLELAGLDDDPIAIRSALWDATDGAYKNALAAYAQKQAALKEVQTQPQADDFSQQKPVIALAAPAKLELDEKAWMERVGKASSLYRENAAIKSSIQYSNAAFHARATTTYLVSSEGTILRKTAQQFEETFAVGTQADDGMRLDRSYASTAASLGDIDSPDVFERHAVEEIVSLAELKKAPLVEEEYHGPVLLSSDASTDTLRAILSPAVIATRPALGTEARTNGIFASSLHARVLPEFLDVTDDPGLKSYLGKALVGAYSFDDEGVPAQLVDLVSDGRLRSYLIGRQPVKDFVQSNGHGRAGVATAPRPHIAVLKVTADSGVTDQQLNQKLVEIAKAAGLTHAYYVQTLAGAGNPRLLYRVNLDGTRQLVRGGELDDVDERALRSSIDAAGKDPLVANYFGDIPDTVIAPALLVDDATVRRANSRNEKLPFYPPPQ